DFVRVAARRADIASVQHCSDDDVVLDRKRREWAYQLKSAANAVAADLVRTAPLNAPASESDGPLIRHNDAANHVEQGGLARAIRPDDGEDRSLRYTDADIVNRKQAAEAFAHSFDFQKNAHGRCCVRPSLAASRGHTPSGSASTTASRQIP